METLYLVGKIIVSTIFFLTSIAMIYLCFKAKVIKEECAHLEKLIKEDIRKIYDTGSMLSKVIIELVLSRYSIF
jgi:hypothetical protein